MGAKEDADDKALKHDGRACVNCHAVGVKMFGSFFSNVGPWCADCRTSKWYPCVGNRAKRNIMIIESFFWYMVSNEVLRCDRD